jgi:hypothetical protein
MLDLNFRESSEQDLQDAVAIAFNLLWVFKSNKLLRSFQYLQSLPWGGLCDSCTLTSSFPEPRTKKPVCCLVIQMIPLTLEFF